MRGITRKDFIRYAVMPGFRQRFADLFVSGFHYVPYFIALVYGAVRLLPPGHVYLNPANMGRFGVRHVIAEAANNLVISRRNIDQILLFFSIILGVILAAAQLGLLALSLFIQPVMAAMPTNFAGFFLTPDPSQDLAAILLDMVFGVPDMFNSCVSTMTPCLNERGEAISSVTGASWPLEPSSFPLPMHVGLHQLFQFYSLGLLVVAVFITCYFIATVVAETAQTGTPFGKRFNKIWAPVRLVMAFGLLIPVGYGYNSAQYIVFYAAKFGSGFATNGWNLFNETLAGESALATKNQTLVAAPNIPEIGGLLQFMYTARTCYEAERLGSLEDGTKQEIKVYVVADPLKLPTNFLEVKDISTPYDELIKFVDGQNQAIIRFGYRDQEKKGHLKGYVDPVCGELVMKLSDPRKSAGSGCTDSCAEKGTEAMQRYYWYVIKELWFTAIPKTIPTFGSHDNYPLNMVHKHTNLNQEEDEKAEEPGADFRQNLQTFYYNDLRAAMNDPASTGLSGIIGTSDGAIEEMNKSGRWTVDPVLRQKGWAGAGIWYNRVAEMNGAMTSAVLNIPLPNRYPKVMEYVYAKKRQQEQNVNFKERFNPVSSDGEAVPSAKESDVPKRYAMWLAFNYWQEGDAVTTTHSAPTGNMIVDIINALFGTEGLFSIRRNPDVHPLAQLTAVGRSLVEGAIRNLTYAAIGGAGGALLATIGEAAAGTLASSASGFLITFSMIGLTAGFILFYVVPFLPFIYFFFAVGAWIKAIFEAMVGAPLWALAHIRIDGEGLAGKAAVSGYFLIFEIFLRPILMIFGFLASISIFSALVSVLHTTFDLVVSNVGGFDTTAEFTGIGASQLAYMRSAIDEFFFTVVYVIIVYLLAMSCFKLIDIIPANILRWIGQSVTPFNDAKEDAGQSLVGSTTVGTQQALTSIGGGLKNLAAMGKKG